MAVIMPRREQRDAEAKSQVNTQGPMTAGQASQQRASYTAAPRTNATNVMRNILAKNQGDVSGATRSKVTNEADTAGERVSNTYRTSASNYVQGLDDKTKELGLISPQQNYANPTLVRRQDPNPEPLKPPSGYIFKPKSPEEIAGQQKPNMIPSTGSLFYGLADEVKGSGYNASAVPTLIKLKSTPKAEPLVLQSQGIDPNAVKKASITPPSKMYSKGMGTLDKLIFEKEGGDRFITEEINRQGDLIDRTREESQSLIDEAANKFNTNLEYTTQSVENYVNNLIEQARRKQEEEAAREAIAKNPMPKLGEGMDEVVPSTPLGYQSPNPAPNYPYPINSPTVPNPPPPDPRKIPGQVVPTIGGAIGRGAMFAANPILYTTAKKFRW